MVALAACLVCLFFSNSFLGAFPGLECLLGGVSLNVAGFQWPALCFGVPDGPGWGCGGVWCCCCCCCGGWQCCCCGRCGPKGSPPPCPRTAADSLSRFLPVRCAFCHRVLRGGPLAPVGWGVVHPLVLRWRKARVARRGGGWGGAPARPAGGAAWRSRELRRGYMYVALKEIALKD